MSQERRALRVVALGGGHGLAATLTAMRTLTAELTAIVTVADDGGSSGRLREELRALPPGDLRMALTALAAKEEWADVWRDLFQYRFPGDGSLGGHAVGNLLLTGLCDITGSPVRALELAGRLLGIQGRVLPLTTADIDIVATTAGLVDGDRSAVVEVRGQHEVATTPGRVVSVRLLPPDPPACPEALAAVEDADWIVLGPGSLFTSVFPHLLLPEMHKAIAQAGARRVFVLNLAAQPGETSGFSPEAHLEALAATAPELAIDHVIADQSVLDRGGLIDAAALLGADVHYAHVAADGGVPRHDPARLADAFAAVMGLRHREETDPSWP